MVSIELRLPESVAGSATLTAWLLDDGDAVVRGQAFARIAVDGQAIDITSPYDGVVSTRLANAADPVLPGGPLAMLGEPKHPEPAEVSILPRLATPLPRRNVRANTPTSGAAVTEEPADGSAEVRPHTRMRRVIAQRMTESLKTAAHTLVVMEADYEGVIAAREALARNGPKLTNLPFVARAVIDSVAEFPLVNSHVLQDSLRVYQEVNLGIAVDLNSTGLVVPVIKDAQDLDAAGISEAIREMASRAREGKPPIVDPSIGTITITNSGGRGSILGRPIINLPQAVIVETDAVEDRVVATRGAGGEAVISIRRRGYLSMSYDHRAFDGAYACGFLARVCARISDMGPAD